MALAIKILITASLTYVVFVVLMVVFQRTLIYHPEARDPFLSTLTPFEQISYASTEGLTLRGVYHPAQPGKPTIVYFHGNAGTLADRLYKAPGYLEEGYGFAVIGYRGYSGNPGQPSETGFYDDARAFIKAIEAKGVAQKDIIIYGESLGTGVASKMAAEHPNVKALVLEAPFTSVTDVGAALFWFLPVRLAIRDHFNSAERIADLKMPLLIIHGKRDLTVPLRFGKRLFSAVQSPVKEMIIFDKAGHNNLYEYQAGEAVRAFLAKL